MDFFVIEIFHVFLDIDFFQKTFYALENVKYILKSKQVLDLRRP